MATLPVSQLVACLSSLLQSLAPLLLLACCFLCFFFLHPINRSRVIPVNWPVVGVLPGVYANLHRILDWLADVAALSGGTFLFRGPWFSVSVLLVADQADLNHIFNLRHANFNKGDDFNSIFDILGNGIFNSDAGSWRYQRRRAHALTSTPEFRSLVVDSSCGKLTRGVLPVLRRKAASGEPVDLQDVFFRYTFDVTCTSVLGVDPGCASPAFSTVPFACAVDKFLEVLFYRHIAPRPWWKLMKWLRVGEERKLAMAWEVIDQFIFEHVAKRREEKASRREDRFPGNLLSSYLDTPPEERKSVVFDDKFLRDTVLNLLVAGRDTTGAGISWFFWLVSTHPVVEDNILKELEKIAPKTSSVDDDGMISFDPAELNKLVYLHAALCESLRLYPPVPLNHKGVVAAEELPSGHRVEPGLTIIVAMYVVGRLGRVWGEDCTEFRPERWVSEQGAVRHEPSYKFVPFGTGPRSCLGKEMAFAQMKAAAAAVLYNFEVEVVKGHVPEPKLSLILQMKNGLLVRLRRRKRGGG